MRFFFYAIIFIFYLSSSAVAQTDSSRLRISLLTCSPGEELYATFGHTAFRIVDSAAETDIVYNYGTFNFDDDGFYLKFMRGKLLYYLSASYFGGPNGFRQIYVDEGRGITEQVLNLSGDEKRSLQERLSVNLMPKNRFYKYDFFFDNCTTRPRDLIVKMKDSTNALKPAMKPGTRFRQAIHYYLEKNNQQWSELGIDILLGKPCDAVMTDAQMQFLPNNLLLALDSSNAHHEYVLSEQVILERKDNSNQRPFFTPMLVMISLLAAIFLIGLLKNSWAKTFLQGFDGLLFFMTGIVGILLVFMWTATDHQMCKYNFNLLWALPTHAIAALFIRSNKNWVKKYFGFTALLMALLCLAWFFLPQQMNNALLPLVILLGYRSAVKWLKVES